MKLTIASFASAFLSALMPSAHAGLTEAEARDYVKRGALVVDVRTAEEYQAKHLTNAISVPLAEVRQRIPTLVTNKSTVLLLHCRSGARSGVAARDLRALGYTNVFNLGSFDRARKILEGAGR